MLAWASALLGDGDRAVRAMEESERLSAEEDILNFVYTHMVRARLAHNDGDLDAAENWARSALECAYRTQGANQRGDANLELARVLAARGRLDEAVKSARTALELFERRDDRPRIEQARAALEAIDG
jgi:ATP/maltotriose-dependent transcriptional regulator MalT